MYVFFYDDSSNRYIKKRDCTIAVPLNKALELPSTLNKQHRSPRRYVYTRVYLI